MSFSKLWRALRAVRCRGLRALELPRLARSNCAFRQGAERAQKTGRSIWARWHILRGRVAEQGRQVHACAVANLLPMGGPPGLAGMQPQGVQVFEERQMGDHARLARE